MKNKIVIVSISGLVLILLMIGLLNHQKERQTSHEKLPSKIVPGIVKSTSQPTQAIDSIKVFLDWSGSMFPYENNENDFFRTDINNLFDLLNKTEPKINWEFFAVNNKISKLHFGLSHFTSGVKVYNNQNIGDVSQTDFEKIFGQLLKQSINNNSINIFISDLIYSTKLQEDHGPQSVAESFESIVENKFHKYSKIVGVVVFKMIANYNGLYSPSFGGLPDVKINQNRPYYILIIARNNIIKKLIKRNDLNNIISLRNNFQGFKNYFVFVNTDSIQNVYYTALPYSKRPVLFSATRNDLKGTGKITDLVVNSNMTDKKGDFYLGIDLKPIPFFNSYLEDPSNYLTSPEGIKILGIKTIASSKITPLDNLRLGSCSRILDIEISQIKPETIKLILQNKLPEWVFNSSSLTDGLHNNVSDSTTFGFEYFMKGLMNAYANNSDIISVKVNIKK